MPKLDFHIALLMDEKFGLKGDVLMVAVAQIDGVEVCWHPKTVME